jgi:hypothetical protein
VINHILGYLDDLRGHTELLEALNWDEDLMGEFLDELKAMLMAAPPNVEKALFWLKNTPWDCFGDSEMPSNVWLVVEKKIRRLEHEVKQEVFQKGQNKFALPGARRNEEDPGTEWN